MAKNFTRTQAKGTIRFGASISTATKDNGLSTVAQMYGIQIGQTLTFNQFVSIFNNIPQVAAVANFQTGRTMTVEDNVQVLKAFGAVNALLIHDGYVLTSKNYFTTFDVISDTTKLDKLTAKLESQLEYASICRN